MQILKGCRSGKSVRSVEFSPDGTKLAASAGNDTLLWDLTTGEHWNLDQEYSWNVAFSPDGKVVAMASASTVRLWDIDTELSRDLELGKAGAYAFEIAFAADGRAIIALGSSISVWDTISGEQLPSSGFDREEARPARACLALTPDRKILATGHRRPSKCVLLWDLEARTLREEITGPTADVSALAFSPGGKYLAATAGTTLWIWEVASKRVVVKHSIDRTHFKDVAFTPDGRFLVFARNDATVSLWDTISWTQAAAYDFGIGPMVSVACAPDGMRAAGGSAKGTIVVFDIDV